MSTIWITFPDPYPKNKQAKHRMTGSDFLRMYKIILKKNGIVRFKTDDIKLFLWSLDQFKSNKLKLKEVNYDLQDSDLDDDLKIMTTYEKRWHKQGRKTYYCEYSIE